MSIAEILLLVANNPEVVKIAAQINDGIPNTPNCIFPMEDTLMELIEEAFPKVQLCKCKTGYQLFRKD